MSLAVLLLMIAAMSCLIFLAVKAVWKVIETVGSAIRWLFSNWLAVAVLLLTGGAILAAFLKIVI